jgi:hypothetical protein
MANDRSVYILRCGPSVEFIEVRAKGNLMQTAGRAMVLWHELSAPRSMSMQLAWVPVSVTGCASRARRSADPRAEMVVAEGMGDKHCQASGAEKSHRRTGTTARRDYASHVE